MKKIFFILFVFSLNVYGAYRPPNSDKYVDSFPSVFQKSQPTYQPAEQYHPNFPPDRPYYGAATPEILPPQRKATKNVAPGKIKGPPIPPPPEEEEQNDQMPKSVNPKEVPENQQVSPKEQMPTAGQSPKETVQNDQSVGRTAKPPPETYEYQGLSTPAPQRAPKQIYPTNTPPPQARPNQGKRPPPPSRPNPMELQHHGELMTHPQPQKNPESGRAIAPFPKYPSMNK